MARPILLNSCARAATRAEARYRIDYPLAPARATRVVALDEAATEVVRAVADGEWAQARFYSAADPGHELTATTGETVSLVEMLEGVDSLIMVATSGANAEAAATIGAACKVRGVMTAGLVITPGELTSDALVALRPHARILMVPAEADDLFELLRAIRA